MYLNRFVIDTIPKMSCIQFRSCVYLKSLKNFLHGFNNELFKKSLNASKTRFA